MKQALPVLLFLTAILTSCENRSIFTELSTNRLTVIIKGTYESSGTPRGWQTMDPNTLIGSGGMRDDSVDDYTNAIDTVPGTVMLDVAEMRLDGKKFANYRQLISASLNDSDPFFNGQGVTLKNDDPVHNKTYAYLNLYIRKLLFDGASRYQYGSSGWEFVEYSTDYFHERTVDGFNINRFQVNTHYDGLRYEADAINRVFPLNVRIPGGMYYNKNYGKVVLEIRIVIKNFLRKYEYDYYVDDVQNIIHFYGLSDWLRDVKEGETDIGGNIHSVARYYVPSMVGTITGTSPGSGYIIAIPSGDSISDYNMNPSLAARGGGICDFPVLPALPPLYIEPYLDYYLKYEKYKSDWNAVLTGCTDFTTYQQEWDNYEITVSNYKIPPLAVWSESAGTYTIDNVMPGSYKVYYLNSSPFFGELPSDAPYVQMNSGNDVTVGVNETVTAN